MKPWVILKKGKLMTNLERRDYDNKQEEVILEEWIWMTYFLNSLAVVSLVEVVGNNSSISISEDLEVIKEVISVINNNNSSMKTFLKIRT